MTRYKATFERIPKKSFKQNLYGHAYAEYGSIKVYANRMQVKNKLDWLYSKGYDVFVSDDHPFVIYLIPEEVNKTDLIIEL